MRSTEQGSNYFTIVDRLDEYLDVTLANPPSLDWLDDQTQKNDRKDAKNLAWYLRMEEIPESYVPSTEFRKYRAPASVRKRKFVDKRSDFKNEVNSLLDQDGITYDGSFVAAAVYDDHQRIAATIVPVGPGH